MTKARNLTMTCVALAIAACEPPPLGPDPVYEELEGLRAADAEALASYDLVDLETGTYQIPIDAALEWVASDPKLLEPVIELPDIEDMTPLARGQYHFENTYACAGCHAVDGSVKQAPALNGRWGSVSEMTDGTKVPFDDAYFRESVYASRAKVVKGYQPIMPPFEGRLPEADFEDIQAYLKSL
ncbi:MAG: cytochrome c [Deltaproteobacteria bacterium]